MHKEKNKDILSILLNKVTLNATEDLLLDFFIDFKDVKISTIKDSIVITDLLSKLTPKRHFKFSQELTGRDILLLLNNLSNTELVNIFNDVKQFKEEVKKMEQTNKKINPFIVENYLNVNKRKSLNTLPLGDKLTKSINSAITNELMMDDNADDELIHNMVTPDMTGGQTLELISKLNIRVRNKVLYDTETVAQTVVDSLSDVYKVAHNSPVLKWLSYIPGLQWLKLITKFSMLGLATYGLVVYICYQYEIPFAVDVIDFITNLVL